MTVRPKVVAAEPGRELRWVASLPGMLRFSDEPESRFFRVQGIALAAVTGLTDFTGSGKGGQLKEVYEHAV